MADTALNILVDEKGTSQVDARMAALEQSMRSAGLTGVDAFEQIERALLEDVSAAERAEAATKGFTDRQVAAAQAAAQLRREISDLNKNAALNQLRAQSDEFAAASKRAAESQRALSNALTGTVRAAVQLEQVEVPLTGIALASQRIQEQLLEIGDEQTFAELALQSDEYLQRVMANERAQEAFSRALQGTPVQQINRDLDEMRRNRALDEQRLQSAEFREELRRTRRVQEELERASLSTFERLSQTPRVLDNIDGSLGLVERAVGAVVAAFKALERGAQLDDLSDGFRRLGINARDVEAAVGGLASRGEVGQLFRQAELSGNQAIIQNFESIVGPLQEAALRTGQDAGALLGGLTQEIESGVAGDALKAFGADAEIVNIRLRDLQAVNESIDLGSSADRGRRAIQLLRLGLDDATITSRTFADESAKQFKQLETSLTDLGEEGLERFARGLSRIQRGTFLSEGFGITFFDDDAEAQVEDVGKRLDEASASANKLFREFVKTGAQDIGATQIAEARDILEQAIDSRLKLRDAENLSNEELRALIVQEGLLDEAQQKRVANLLNIEENSVRIFSSATNLNDAAKTFNDLSAIGIERETAQLEVQLQQVEARLANSRVLTDQERQQAEVTKEAILTRLEVARTARFVGDIDDRIQALGVEELSNRFEQTRLSAFGIAQALEQATTAGEGLQAIGGGIARTLGAAIGIAQSREIGINKDTPGGGGGGSRSDPSDLLFEASLIGLDEFARRNAEARRTFSDTVKEFEGDLQALSAADAIFFDATQSIENDRRAQFKEIADEIGGFVETAFLAPVRQVERVQDQIFERSLGAAERAQAKIDAFTADRRRNTRVGLLAEGIAGSDTPSPAALRAAADVDAVVQARDRILEEEQLTLTQRIELDQEANTRLAEIREEARLAEEEATLAHLESTLSTNAQIGENALELAEMELEFTRATVDGTERASAAWLSFASNQQRAAIQVLEGTKKGTVAIQQFAVQTARSSQLVAKGQLTSTQATLQGVVNIVDAGGTVAQGFITDAKAQAVVGAIIETARGLSAAATPGGQIAAGLHFASAAQYAILSTVSTPTSSRGTVGGASARGGGGGGGSGGGAGGSAGPQLAPIVPQGPQGPLVFLQVSTNVSADTQVRVLNDAAASGSGIAFDGRLIPVGGPRREDFV